MSDCNCDFSGCGIVDRLARADRRIACVDRRLGTLTARLFWNQQGSTAAEEVPIFEHQNKGLTPKNWKTGTEIEGYRHSFKLDFAWWQSKQGQYGIYSIQLPGESLLQCEVESQNYQPGETSASLDLRVINSTATYA
jgi:hypothetical protein